jgi:hypothetical protein
VLRIDNEDILLKVKNTSKGEIRTLVTYYDLDQGIIEKLRNCSELIFISPYSNDPIVIEQEAIKTLKKIL